MTNVESNFLSQQERYIYKAFIFRTPNHFHWHIETLLFYNSLWLFRLGLEMFMPILCFRRVYTEYYLQKLVHKKYSAKMLLRFLKTHYFQWEMQIKCCKFNDVFLFSITVADVVKSFVQIVAQQKLTYHVFVLWILNEFVVTVWRSPRKKLICSIIFFPSYVKVS